MTEGKVWTVPVISVDSANDLALEFPDDFMEEAGWKVGDTLIWSQAEDGTITLKKKESQ